MYERLLQGTGRSMLSMYTQGLGAIINIALDPVFIFVLDMGVAGAAVATIIGQFCGCALAIYFNHKKNTDITLSLRGFRPDWRLIGEIYAIGLPSVIMIAIGSVMTFLMNKILITYHSAHETLYASCIMIFGMILFLAIPGPLLKIFDATDTMLTVGVPALRIISLSFCMAGACISLSSSFQALGKSTYSMILSILRQLGVLVPAAYLLARYGASIGSERSEKCVSSSAATIWCGGATPFPSWPR